MGRWCLIILGNWVMVPLLIVINPCKSLLSECKAISSGTVFGYILLDTGELKGFGNRSFGRIGDGFPLADDWTQVDIADGVRDFEMGAISSFILENGQVLNVGSNSNGGLGNGSLENNGKFFHLPNTSASKVAVSH